MADKFPDPKEFGVTLTNTDSVEPNPKFYKSWRRNGLSAQRLARTINATLRLGKVSQCGRLIAVTREVYGDDANTFLNQFTRLTKGEIEICSKAYSKALEVYGTPKAQWYPMLLAYAEQRSMKKGFAYFRYKDRWNEPPPEDNGERLEPAADVVQFCAVQRLKYAVSSENEIKAERIEKYEKRYKKRAPRLPEEMTEKEIAKLERRKTRRQFQGQSFGPASKVRRMLIDNAQHTE